MESMEVGELLGWVTYMLAETGMDKVLLAFVIISLVTAFVTKLFRGE